ncbi:MAG: HRDC domain-containing protein [Desulfobacterales bacterium]|nr:HRDC domain-containing protein [Desulfobacterales bacterium]
MFKIFCVAFEKSSKGFNDEMINKFLLNKELKSWKAEFFQNENESYWTVFVEYDEILKEKYILKEEENLEDTEKVLLDRLKKWRKERADKDGLPVFIIANNSELLRIVQNAPKSIEELKIIKGFGKAKIEKYGDDIIGIVNAFYEKS